MESGVMLPISVFMSSTPRVCALTGSAYQHNRGNLSRPGLDLLDPCGARGDGITTRPFFHPRDLPKRHVLNQYSIFNVERLPRVFCVPATHNPVRCLSKYFQTLYTLRIAAVYTVNISSHIHAPRSRTGRRTGRTRRVTHQFNLSPLIS